MYFAKWMKQYLNEPSIRGSLARSIRSEGRWFPHNRCYKTIRRYIQSQGADEKMIAVFDECWSEYEREKRRN